MGVSENSGFSPQIIHGLIGFSIIFTIHFGYPYFLETPTSKFLDNSVSSYFLFLRFCWYSFFFEHTKKQPSLETWNDLWVCWSIMAVSLGLCAKTAPNKPLFWQVSDETERIKADLEDKLSVALGKLDVSKQVSGKWEILWEYRLRSYADDNDDMKNIKCLWYTTHNMYIYIYIEYIFIHTYVTCILVLYIYIKSNMNTSKMQYSWYDIMYMHLYR